MDADVVEVVDFVVVVVVVVVVGHGIDVVARIPECQ